MDLYWWQGELLPSSSLLAEWNEISHRNFVEIKMTVRLSFAFSHRIIGGSKGGARDACPPGGPNSFIFMQFLAKIWKIIAILGVGAPPWGKSWIRHCEWSRLCPLPYAQLGYTFYLYSLWNSSTGESQPISSTRNPHSSWQWTHRPRAKLA